MRRIPKTLRLLFVILFCLTTLAFADDSGPKTITQGSVMYAGGFPYKITQPGSYRLGGNLTVPANTDGIDITADNVTLDLNGFTIAGPVTCTGTVAKPLPISSCSFEGGIGVFSANDNIKLTNGSVVGFYQGIFLSGAGHLIEQIQAKFNRGVGVFINNGTVRDCSSIKNGGHGIDANGGVIEGSLFFGNGGDGVLAEWSTVIANTFGSNGVGMVAFYSVYGSNTFNFNGTDIFNDGGNTSQNNNNCSGTTC